LSNLSEPLSFRPRVSGMWLLVLAGLAAGCLILLADRAPPLPLFLIWVVVVLMLVAGAWRNQRRLHRLRRCHLHPDGRIYLQSRDGRRRGARVLGRFAHPWLVALSVRTVDGQRFDLFIPRGQIGAEHHRRLRVWVRSRVGEAPPSVSPRATSAGARRAGVSAVAGWLRRPARRRARGNPG